MGDRADIITQTVQKLNKELLATSDKPLHERVQELIHQQFLKVSQPSSIILEEDFEDSQVQLSEYQMDKEKFVPSQDLLNKFQELYPFSINEVQKVLPEIMQPLFNQPNQHPATNPFLGVTTFSNTNSFVKPWIVEKKQLKLDEFCINELPIHASSLQINTSPIKFYNPSQLVSSVPTTSINHPQRESKTGNTGSEAKEKNGLDYWKNKRSEMMKSIK